eukprot:3252757-Amphidinium_carterae.2
MTAARTGTAGPYPPALHAFRPTPPVWRQSHRKAIRGPPAGFQALSTRAPASLQCHPRDHGDQRASS